jgi:hypothetical protein
MYSGELEGRVRVADAGRGGNGEVAVARSSELPAGVPHAEQKRPLTGTSVPQDEQRGMNFSRYSLPRRSESRLEVCDSGHVAES